MYVADNQMGVARIAMLPSPHYISSIQPAIANGVFGYVWVVYDSVQKTIVVSDRGTSYNQSSSPPTELNRLLGAFYSPVNDTLVQLQQQGYEGRNCGPCTLFHDRDSTLHMLKPHTLGHGFNVMTLVGSVMVSPAVPYLPPIASFTGIRQAVLGQVSDSNIVFGVAEEYGLVSLYCQTWNSVPQEVGHLDLPGLPKWVAKRGSICYIATKWSGLAVASVSDPRNPQLIRLTDVPNSDEQYQVEVSTDSTRLFVVDNLKGVYAYSLDDPTNPQYLGLLPVLRPVSICCYQNYLIVCSEAEGLMIYRM